MIHLNGIIGFKELKISCIIGVWPDERNIEQNILIDLEVESSFFKCSSTDNYLDTIDYSSLALLVEEIATSKKYMLIETLAHDCLKEIFIKYPVNWAKICVKKPSAIPKALYAFVILEKGKKKTCGH